MAALRGFSGLKPFIKDSVDTFSEVSQWQIFFVMLLALLLKADSDAGEGAGTQGVYDTLLVAVQFIGPLAVVYLLTRKVAVRVQRAIRRGAGERGDEPPDPLEGLRQHPWPAITGGGEGQTLEMTSMQSRGKERQEKRTSKFSSGNPLHASADGMLTMKEGGGAQSVIGGQGDGVEKGKEKDQRHIERAMRYGKKVTVNGGSVLDKKGKKRAKAPSRASLIPPPPEVKLAKDKVEPPELPPPVREEDSDSDPPPPPPPKKARCPWSEHWDDDYKALYYLHEDGSSTWDLPKGYWRNDL